MSFQQDAFQGDALQVGLGDPPPTPPNRPILFASGQSNAHILALGAAIGAAVIFGHGEFAPSQPIPQVSQWEYAPRSGFQPQPVIFHQQPAAAVVAAPNPFRRVEASPQADPTQRPPQFWRQQPDLIPMPGGDIFPPGAPQRESDRAPVFFKIAVIPSADPGGVPFRPVYAFPQPDTYQLQPLVWQQTPGQRERPVIVPFEALAAQDPFQIQPQVFKQQPAPVVVQAAPFAQLSAAPQSDPTQIQPVVFKQQPAGQSPPFKAFFAKPQEDPTQLQPTVWKQPAFEATPLKPTLFASPQADPTQLQPSIHPYFFDQARQDTPNRPFYASPQADPTQRAAVFFPIAELPSVTPAPVDTTQTPAGRKRIDRYIARFKGEDYVFESLEGLEAFVEWATQAEKPKPKKVRKPVKIRLTPAFEHEISPFVSIPTTIYQLPASKALEQVRQLESRLNDEEDDAEWLILLA